MDEYREIVKLAPVLLLRDDLPRLEHVLGEDLTPRPDSVEIWVFDGARRISSKSMAQLFEKELPETTSRFDVFITSWSAAGESDASVSVYLNHDFASYELRAQTEPLFLGKKAQLDKFFRQHRPWYAPITRALPLAGPLVLSFGVIAAAFFAAQGRIFTSASALALAVVSGITLWLGFRQTLFPYVRVRLIDRSPRRSAWELATFLLQVVLLIATIANTVVGVLAIMNSRP